VLPRHLRLPVLLGVAAVAALVAALVAASGTHQRVASPRGGGPTARLVTPVLSARRVPAFASRGIATGRLQAAVAPVLARMSGDLCFSAAADGTVLVDHPAAGGLMPASNQKLATAFAALKVLDPTATLSTKVASDRAPGPDGTVGTLWFIGGGDPLISTANYVATSKYGQYPYTPLSTIADRVVAAGVRHVTGSVVGDDSRYDGQRTIPTWSPGYLADNQVGPLTALAVNDAKTYPATDQPGPVGSPRAASDPATYAADALATMLRARGVVVDGPAAAGRAPDGRNTLVDVPSLPIGQLVAEMLTFSDNNTAELLVKEMGVATSGTGSTTAGLDAVRAALDGAGIPTEGAVEVDGSGLDRGDRATCAELRSILTTSGPTGTIHDALPVGGETGTLRDRFRNPAIRGKVRAKTGTLRDVTALSGWVDGQGGTHVAFSLLLNTGGRQVSGADLSLAEQAAGALASYPDSPSPLLLLPKPATTG
jgi:D-alanyl-D-alanine carboxypeptidase/D-alanyl-D-alanine-endopeptidase (penicillin-binding protein 4)